MSIVFKMVVKLAVVGAAALNRLHDTNVSIVRACVVLKRWNHKLYIMMHRHGCMTAAVLSTDPSCTLP